MKPHNAGLDIERRGGHNKVFSVNEEKILYNRISALLDIDKRGLTDSDIVNMVNKYYRELHGPPLRPPHSFSASHGWVTDFKRRWAMPSGPPRRTKAAPPDPDEVEKFIEECRRWMPIVGRHRFYNVDETKWRYVHPPRLVITCKGHQQYVVRLPANTPVSHVSWCSFEADDCL